MHFGFIKVFDYKVFDFFPLSSNIWNNMEGSVINF